ncbi:hypothetical protein OSB04_014046 [Centaurea solstitialis]|uniref:Uncharacterized protein n=1 Tax=Centaurea solstitialis TaxID=347529 RepID=A0AA38WFK9_9ASTR|nr:hypothetical protein OSB04_014046 [Centaurea solstitialis]
MEDIYLFIEPVIKGVFSLGDDLALFGKHKLAYKLADKLAYKLVHPNIAYPSPFCKSRIPRMRLKWRTYSEHVAKCLARLAFKQLNAAIKNAKLAIVLVKLKMQQEDEFFVYHLQLLVWDPQRLAMNLKGPYYLCFFAFFFPTFLIPSILSSSPILFYL